MARVASSQRLSLEYWGRHRHNCLRQSSPLDLVLAPILLAAEPAGGPPWRPR